MRILVALGGNALLKRGEPMTAERAAGQRPDRRHGAGAGGRAPPAGAVPRQRPPGRAARAPGGRLQGRRGLPARPPRRPDRGDDRLPDRAGAREPAAGRGAVRHDPDDGRGRRRRPGLRRPDQVRRTRSTTTPRPRRWPPRRGGCSSATATASAASSPSPAPKRIFEIRPIRWLLEHGVVVICAGGGGIPTTWVPGKERTLGGVEAVIDKDFASELLAREVDADLFVMATDVDGVYEDWGTPEQRRLDRVTPAELRSQRLRRRVDGPEGRSRGALRRGDRQARRHRRAGRHREDRRGPRPARTSSAATRRERKSDELSSVCTRRWASCAR